MRLTVAFSYHHWGPKTYCCHSSYCLIRVIFWFGLFRRRCQNRWWRRHCGISSSSCCQIDVRMNIFLLLLLLVVVLLLLLLLLLSLATSSTFTTARRLGPKANVLIANGNFISARASNLCSMAPCLVVFINVYIYMYIYLQAVCTYEYVLHTDWVYFVCV